MTKTLIVFCLAVGFLAVSVQGRVLAEDQDVESARVKRCANLLDDSCINGQLPGSGGDGDYFGSGSSPGKRSSLLEVFKNQMENGGRTVRCANLLDDSCINGQLPGSGGDGDYFGSGSSPGKRSSLWEIFRNKIESRRKPGARCANLLDDSCINGQLPGSGGDGDYFGSGSSPGKRSTGTLLEIFKNQMENGGGKTRRCANLLDDSCINGQLPGSGGDGDYFGSGSSPGKRSSVPFLAIYQNKMENTGKVRRCANLLDDSCINGQLPGSGGDGDYFGSGSSPGKRSASLEMLIQHYCAQGHVGACRLLAL